MKEFVWINQFFFLNLTFGQVQYSQRHSVINHCDRRITLLSDPDIFFGLFNLFTYIDMPFGWQLSNTLKVSPRFLCRLTTFFFDLLEPWDVRELYIRKTADLLLQLCVDTFPRLVVIRFYFLSETLI